MEEIIENKTEDKKILSTPYLVAYMDLLGTKQMIANNENLNNVQHIY